MKRLSWIIQNLINMLTFLLSFGTTHKLLKHFDISRYFDKTFLHFRKHLHPIRPSFENHIKIKNTHYVCYQDKCGIICYDSWYVETKWVVLWWRMQRNGHWVLWNTTGLKAVIHFRSQYHSIILNIWNQELATPRVQWSLAPNKK